MAEPELEAKIGGDSSDFVAASKRAQKSLGKLEKEGTDTSSTLKKTFAAVSKGLVTLAKGAAVAGTALGAIGTAAVVSFAQFESKFAQVTTLIDESPDQINKLESDLRDLSVTMGVDLLEATEAAYQAISAGQEPAKVVDFLAVAFKGAAAGASTATESVDALTTVMNAFEGQSISAERASDVLFATIKAGKTTMSELAGSLGQVAPIAASAGVKFEDMSAALATMTASGLSTAEASTALKAVITGILKPSKSAAEALDRIGVSAESLKDPTRGLSDAIDRIRAAVISADGELIDFLPNVRAFGGAAILSGDGFDKLNETLELTNNATGAADAAFNKVKNTLVNQFARASETARDAFRSLGEAIAPVASILIDKFTVAFEGVRFQMQAFVEFMQTNFDQVEAAVLVFVDAGKAAFGEFASALGLEMKAVGGTFKNVLGLISGNREQIITTVAQISRVVGVTAGAILKFGEKVIGFVDGIVSSVSATFDSLGGDSITLLDRFAGAITGLQSVGLAVEASFRSVSASIIKVAEIAALALEPLLQGASLVAAATGQFGLSKDLFDAANAADEWRKTAANAFDQTKKDLDETRTSLLDIEGRYRAIREAVGSLTSATTELATATAGVGDSQGSGGNRRGSGRRSSARSESGQIESRQRGGFLGRTGKFEGHKGEFIINRRASLAIGPEELRRMNRRGNTTVNNTINASDRSTLGSLAQIRTLLPEMRRQTKLGVRQGSPF